MRDLPAGQTAAVMCMTDIPPFHSKPTCLVDLILSWSDAQVKEVGKMFMEFLGKITWDFGIFLQLGFRMV